MKVHLPSHPSLAATFHVSMHSMLLLLNAVYINSIQDQSTLLSFGDITLV